MIGRATGDRMRILLTGASGFVGHHVLASLASMDVDLHAVSRRRPPVEATCTWHEADLLDPAAAQALVNSVRPDCILHLAWCVEHGKFWTDAGNLDWVGATLRLAQAAAGAGVTRFVGTGTCYEYDWPASGVCDERSTPLLGHTLYDTAKDGSRRILETFFRQTGIQFSWARLFFLYGPHEAPGRLMPSVARALSAGEPALCSRGAAMRDFMDVRDAGGAIAALALSDVEGAVNIGTGEGVSVADVASMMGELAGRPDLVRLGALPDRPGEPPRIVAATDRLRHEVGYGGSRPLESGLRDVLSFWHKAAA